MPNPTQFATVATMLLLQVFLAWRLIAATRAVHRLQARLTTQGEALSLLTDTSENGFTAIARELDRLVLADRQPGRHAIADRVATAASKGRSVADIAASERVSEGEVRLRLHFAHGTTADAVAAQHD